MDYNAEYRRRKREVAEWVQGAFVKQAEEMSPYFPRVEELKRSIEIQGREFKFLDEVFEAATTLTDMFQLVKPAEGQLAVAWLTEVGVFDRDTGLLPDGQLVRIQSRGRSYGADYSPQKITRLVDPEEAVYAEAETFLLDGPGMDLFISTMGQARSLLLAIPHDSTEDSP